MKKAHIEKDTGKLLGWYDDDFHGVKVPAVLDENRKVIKEESLDLSAIPAGCIEVTEEAWSAALEISANCYEGGKFIVKEFRTQAEIDAHNLQMEIMKADAYLKETEWVENYKIRHDLGLDTIAADSEKWQIIKKREEYKEFLKSL